MLELESYTVSKLLYEDAATRTYRGIDWQRRCGVILKTPRSEAPGTRQLARLRRDHEFMAQLGCAGVMRPVALVEHGRSLVSVQEDMGGDLLSALGPAACPLEVFFPLALALVEVLDRVHRRRVIHLDLKPQSIFFDRDSGRVHLGDFGLASRLSREHPQAGRPELIEGALPYIAPEQTGLMNRTVDFRADYYSLGIVFYQMLTGQLPFTAGDALEWVHCHLARPPRSPRDWAPGLPPSLAALVLKLLSKVAEERYQSAAGLRADLLICQLHWKQDRDVAFELGRADISEQLQLPQKLYGREPEVQQLLAAFERTAHGGHTEWILIAGYSGIGKSVLVAELYKPIVARRGRYISGKFDQYKRGIPYAAMAEALRGLVQQLLAETPERIRSWRERLRARLGETGQALVDLIPLIERLIGSQPPLAELPPEQAQHRARTTFQKFVAVFATAEHPLVLFLDDLQWIDPGSLSLLTQLANSPDTRHLLLIGAFRDNEVGPTHLLSVALESLGRDGNSPATIVLAPLGANDICSIVADALHCSTGDAAPLAELVYAKTRGNPFFCFQFITALYQDELLAFDPERRHWVWDLAQIQARDLTDNVVDLMAGELRRLAEATREALRLAGFLGSRFELQTLANVLRQSAADCEAGLWPALQTGLLIAQEGGYQFLHDRVQEAAYSLTPILDRPATHLRIGRLLLESIPAAELEERLFATIAHLNSGAAGIDDPVERHRYAGLNLRAGVKAQAATAYPAACEYFAAGMTLLPSQPWSEDRALTYNLYLARAECEYLAGRFVLADRLLDELLAATRDPVERARAYLVKIKLQVTRGDNPGACETAQASLIELGVRLPLRPNKQQVGAAYQEIQQLMAGRSLEALLELPQISDPAMAMALRVITSTSTAAIFTDQSLWALHDTQMVILSLRYGNSDDAVMAYLFYGFMLGAYFNHYREGYRFTQIAYQLMERRGATQHRGSLVYHQALAALWIQPLSEGIAAMRSSLPALLEVGNMIIACLALRFIATYHLLRGDPLEQVEEATQRCRVFALEKHYPVVVALNESTRGLVQKLRGEPPGIPPKHAEAPLAEALLRDAADSTDRIPFVIVAEQLSAMTWHCLMGDHTEARRLLQEAEPLLWAIPGLLPNYDYYYYGSLSLAADFNALAAQERAGIQQQLAANLEQLRIWAENNPTTFERSYQLVAAEIARIEGRVVEAMRLYQKAIATARAGNYVQDEALASERAACYHEELGLADSAEAHLRTAYDSYARWGAAAKLRRLEASHPQLREQRAPGHAATETNTLAHLDALAIARATQAISGQIVRESLLETLVRITLEQAGAQSGALLLVEGEQQRLAATALAGIEDIRVQVRKEPDPDPEPPLPRSILSYVQQSREPLILGDTLALRPFGSDPYLQHSPPASILCLPILRQDALVGLLYLEHRDVAQVFTLARLAVLEQLAAQAAISLENSQLYGRLAEYSRTLEERVATRTEELRTTIQDLEAFSATLSHDLRAPLRHIGAFAEMLGKHSHAVLDPTGQRYLDVMKRSAGRMDQLITKLLEFSRTSRAPLEPATVDVGELVFEAVEALQTDCAERRIEWRIQHLPRVIGDNTLLRAVLTNLIGNAIKYTRPRDPAIIEIGCSSCGAPAGALVTFYIRDNGVGFDPAFTHKLFGEFQRLHDTAQFEGSGIGLVSVRRIIQRHGGKVWAEGVLDVGATFYFSLPTAAAGE